MNIIILYKTYIFILTFADGTQVCRADQLQY